MNHVAIREDCQRIVMCTRPKPRLLVLELWGLGDLALASAFLSAASESYNVSLLAKPAAEELRPRFWPKVELIRFNAPWTAFERKYHIWRWPGKTIHDLLRRIRTQEFDLAVSVRSDPRDHLLMALTRAKRRLGFSRWYSRQLLTEVIPCGAEATHRYSRWAKLAEALDLELRPQRQSSALRKVGPVVIHTGAGHSIRVWPLERYAGLIRRLRSDDYLVQVICDADQLGFWVEQGEMARVSRTPLELLDLLGHAAVVVGNDSGPGHLAALSGIPTFTIFGPQLPALFAPVHPAAEWIEGAPCPYKPCYDRCHFPAAHCLLDLDEESVWKRLQAFVARWVAIPQRIRPRLV